MLTLENYQLEVIEAAFLEMQGLGRNPKKHAQLLAILKSGKYITEYEIRLIEQALETQTSHIMQFLKKESHEFKSHKAKLI